MPVTIDGFRRMALALPDVAEVGHMGHPDFRVRGKIFATLGYPDAEHGMVKLTPEQQHAFVDSEPRAFAPVRGGWGLRGATQVHLRAASLRTLRPALILAWRNAAPKSLGLEALPSKTKAPSSARRKSRRVSRS